MGNSIFYILFLVAVYYKALSHVINGAVDNAASSLPHKQHKTNNDDGHHIVHTGT